jgi:hypothetical protein
MAWGMVAGAVAGPLIGSMMSDDHGAGAANAQATESSAQQAAIAKEQWDRYKTVYAPLEDKYAQESQNYGSIANQEKAAGRANADVRGSYAGARERLNRQPGFNPSSSGYLQEMNKISLAEAAGAGAAQTAARDGVIDKGLQMETNALSLGKGMPAQSLSGFGDAAQSGFGLSQAGYSRQAADQAGFGNMVGGVLKSPGFNNWLNPKASTPQGGSTAPGGSSFGSDLGFDN